MSENIRKVIDELDAKASALEAEADRLRSIADPLRSLLTEEETALKPQRNGRKEKRTTTEATTDNTGKTKSGCIKVLQHGPLTTKEMAAKSGLKQTRISVCVSQCKGTFRKAGGGKWELINSKVPDPDANHFIYKPSESPKRSSIDAMLAKPMATSSLKDAMRSQIIAWGKKKEFTRADIKSAVKDQFEPWDQKDDSNLACYLTEMTDHGELTRRGYGTMAIYSMANIITPKVSDPEAARISVPREL